MTVVCGRARFGAGSVLRAMICGAFAMLGLVTGGCGSSTVKFGTSLVTVSSVPGPFTSYLVYLDSMTLTRSDGQIVSALGTTTPIERIDLTRLNDMTELFGAPAVVEGTYASASVTVDYTGAQISVDVGGQSVAATVVDSTGVAAGIVTYTVKFDPAHPLVITQGVTSQLDLNFDVSASAVTNPATSPATVTVRGFLSASTVPVYTKPIRARGVFVTGNTSANSFVMNTRPFFDVASNPIGALTVQTTGQTTYNVNGVNYTGAPGLAALSALPINTTVAAYGSAVLPSGTVPVFNATQVYAGVSLETGLEDRVTGTVSARTTTSTGTTITLHGATVASRLGVEQFVNDLPMTVDAATIVSVDGQPNLTGLTQQSISIGQQVDAGVQIVTDTAGNLTGVNGAGGLIRLTPTPVWGRLNAGAAVGSASLNVITLGGYEPAAFTFTGTGSSVGQDSKSAAYVLNTGAIDESGTALNTLLRFDGIVNAFGAAQPDFNAVSVTPVSATEQVLAIEWSGSGATAPFVSASSTGLVVNVGNTPVGLTHGVRTGPVNTTDLTNPAVNPTIVPDPALGGQFALGNPATTTGIAVFNSFASFVTQINTTLNGTNSLQKLVAVGHYNETNSTFTAYRIDLVQVQ